MDCSTPGFPVLHYLPEFALIQAAESVMLSNRLFLCHLIFLLSSVFPRIRVFSSELALSYLRMSHISLLNLLNIGQNTTCQSQKLLSCCCLQMSYLQRLVLSD